jgi:hypothetical protein
MLALLVCIDEVWSKSEHSAIAAEAVRAAVAGTKHNASARLRIILTSQLRNFELS